LRANRTAGALFHTAPVTGGTAFQARFHVVFQIAHDELGHRNSFNFDIMISYLMIGGNFKSEMETVRPIIGGYSPGATKAEPLSRPCVVVA
jgi:hypothetical protein